MATHKPAIAYFRVSTAKQGAEGNGIEAQRAAVERLVASHNFDVVAKFTEVESGTRKRRPELVKALAACGEHKATLLIAKIDRLARNVAFIATLMESGVAFKCADMPEIDKFTIHILAAVAEREAELISVRTEEALSVVKRKLGEGSHVSKSGRTIEKLGAPDPRVAAAAASKIHPAAADAYAEAIVKDIDCACTTGKPQSLRDLAESLTGRGVPTRQQWRLKGGTTRIDPERKQRIQAAVWHPSSVRNVLHRLESMSKLPASARFLVTTARESTG